jgi:GntR family transcriptional regulator of vanillate catabolism
MASQIEHVVTELRRRIMSGELAAGERIVELTYAPELGVSRTPLRLALVELERQGLLETVGKRGFRVRGVTLDEVAAAIDVRGVLEGHAVRLIAERGLRDDVHLALTQCVAEGRVLLEQAGSDAGTLDCAAWAAMNENFHRLLVDAAGSDPLRSALEHVTKSPLVGAGALAFSGQPVLELSFLQRAQADHEDLLQALRDREGGRAEALMREHARRSRDNKKLLMEHSSERAPGPMLAAKAARRRRA